MRVIGGELRSRRLKSLRGRAVRPTGDRLRETLFNVLGGEVVGAVWVDAYAGTGAVGIEALSRGARQVVFIEKDRTTADVLRANLATLGLEARARVLEATVARSLRGIEAGIVFVDPPYDAADEYAVALRLLGESPPALVVVEHGARSPLEAAYGRLRRVRVLRQGDSSLSFYRPGGGQEAS